MKYLKMFVLCTVLALSNMANAKGGFSGGGARGGFSGGGGRSFSSAPISRPAPSVAPRPNSQPTVTRNPQVAPNRTVTTTTTTVNRSYSTRVNYGAPVHYGVFGMGYGYNNGLLTGMIIGNMLHPMNTVVYTGGGMYNNNALLYPDGRVVNQQGILVGTYVNGVFSPIQNGGMVAQQVPQDAYQAQAPAPQPVVIQNGPNAGEIFIAVFLSVMMLLVMIAIIT